ncbi:glycerol-3-phosphate 1-O-acyltransferase PlsY [Ruminococcus sp.]|uniref:glycerol-3-phosphate 1-O-acyltransferase PlsY n=1 Tax=Ruminococcus sp. TaxID=41978 RepID=UPI00388F8531
MTIELIIRTVATIVIAYLIGSINPAIFITRLKTGQDIRTMGSGNAGFTNVLRSVGKGPAIATIIFDYLKGIVGVAIGWWIFANLTVTNDVSPTEYVIYGRYLAGMFVIIGHSFPLYFKFKGGKGVVTANALMLVVDWRVFLLVLGTFLIIFFATKIISLGSIACAAIYPVYTMLVTYFLDYLPRLNTPDELRFRFVLISTGCAFVVGLMVIIRHNENIGRLLRGEEKRIKAKK